MIFERASPAESGRSSFSARLSDEPNRQAICLGPTDSQMVLFAH